MTLNGIHIVDFGNHKNTRLTFGKMTALVGQNGSGKTTVMRAVQELHRAAHEESWTGMNTERSRQGHQSRLAASWTKTPGPQEAAIGAILDKDNVFLKRDGSVVEISNWFPDSTDIAKAKDAVYTLSDLLPSTRSNIDRTIQFLELRHSSFPWRCRYFKANSRTLQDSSYSEKSSPSLGEEGDELASTLAYLMTAEPERFGRIMEALREVVPAVKRVRAKPAQIKRMERKSIVINKQERSFEENNVVMGQELIFDMVSGQGLPASAVSEGTLIVLAVLTLLYSEETTDLIMLDDIELGLHPKAQRDLIKQLRLIQEQHKDVQIIVSTHSPYVVDELKPEEVWLFSTDAEGCAVSARLDQHPNAAQALEVLTTGEFWSSEGESWVSEIAASKQA